MSVDERPRRVDARLGWMGKNRRWLAQQLGSDPNAVTRLLNHGLAYKGKASWERVAEALGVPLEALEVGGPLAPLWEAQIPPDEPGSSSS